MSRCKSSFKVVCYQKDGTLFRVYDSALSAAKSRKAYPRSIDKCIRGDTLTAFGYMWRRYPENKIPERIEPLQRKSSVSRSTPIALVDISNHIIKVYDSIRKASLDNDVDPHSIRDVLSGKARLAKGKKYRYLSDIELEKYHLKNGDNFTRKNVGLIQYTLNKEYVKTYPSISEAAKSLGKNPRLISDCLKGKYKTAYGYIWRYKSK